MHKLDWYILKKFLVTFIFCMLLFTVIAVAVDSSEKADDFVTAGFSTKEIINKYYLGFVPWIWSLLFPLFVFIAVIFHQPMATRSGSSRSWPAEPAITGLSLFYRRVFWLRFSGWATVTGSRRILKANFSQRYRQQRP
jgi:hypothetical protein